MFNREYYNGLKIISRAQQMIGNLTRAGWNLKCWRPNTKIFAASDNRKNNIDTVNGYKLNHTNNDYIRKYSTKSFREPSFLDCFMTDHGENDEIELPKAKEPKRTQESKIGANFRSIRVKLKQPFKLYNLKTFPETTVRLTKDQALAYYKQMQTIRHLEVASGALYKEKVIRGFCHLYSGQEACAVGIKAAMRDQDNVITAHRCHGWCYMMNISSAGILTELTGRKTGCQRGKGGSMHMYSSHFYGGNGIVGAQVPLGTGIALSCKYRKDGSVCFALYGDCAANQGQVFESFNTASAWKLPVVFVCENNSYDSNSCCNHNYYTRGNVLPGLWVDGMNILAVRSAAAFAIDYVSKNGPMIMEVNTCRCSCQSRAANPSSALREEIPVVHSRRDPILSFKKLCQERSLLNKMDIKSIDEAISQEINEAVRKSITDPSIEVKELTDDIYSQNLESEIRCATGYTHSHNHSNKQDKH